MIKRSMTLLFAAAMLGLAPVHAGDRNASQAAADAGGAPAADVRGGHSISFKRDVKEAWAQAQQDGRRAGRAIGDGARSLGRATRDAAVKSWRAVKETFSGA
jgi:hypothetical protein